MNKMKAIICCAILQCSSFALFSENVSANVSDSYTNKETGNSVEIEASQGYRQDKLKWSFSGPHRRPNIISELTFKDIRISQNRITSQLKHSGYFAKMQLGYGYIWTGKMQDSDYARSHRKAEFSRSHHKISKGYELDATIALGKDIALSNGFTLSPLFGYMWEKEKFHIKGGRQTRFFGAHVNAKRPFRKLHSTSTSTWDAPFIGVRSNMKASDDLQFFAEYDFLFAVRYQQTGHWNLRNMNFESHSKRIKGFGQKGLIGASLALSDNCSLKAEYELSRLTAKGGSVKAKERHHRHDPQPFHKAVRTASEIRLSLDCAF